MPALKKCCGALSSVILKVLPPMDHFQPSYRQWRLSVPNLLWNTSVWSLRLRRSHSSKFCLSFPSHKSITQKPINCPLSKKKLNATETQSTLSGQKIENEQNLPNLYSGFPWGPLWHWWGLMNPKLSKENEDSYWAQCHPHFSKIPKSATNHLHLNLRFTLQQGMTAFKSHKQYWTL